ncbi:MAG: hypothetical protein NTZ54_09435 [Alphaproteobacteria bacterium]|nr:hypothetical protein [Alphaproteobacteria bacterium]
MTLKRILNWVVGLPIAIIGVGFAVANREWVTVSFDPINRAQPFATVNMPLWALFFAGVLFGHEADGFFGFESDVAQSHEREKRELQQNLPAVRPDTVS